VRTAALYGASVSPDGEEIFVFDRAHVTKRKLDGKYPN
jgi:hypothetical protein